MAPTEKVATASRLEARMVRISSTDSPPSRSAMASGTQRPIQSPEEGHRQNGLAADVVHAAADLGEPSCKGRGAFERGGFLTFDSMDAVIDTSDLGPCRPCPLGQLTVHCFGQNQRAGRIEAAKVGQIKRRDRGIAQFLAQSRTQSASQP